MPNTAPIIRYHQVVSQGNGLIAQTNCGGAMGTAGPVTTIMDGTHLFDFGSVEAGMWLAPQILLVEFDGNTASNLDLKVYDTGSSRADPVDSNQGEDFFANYSNNNTSGTSWLFRSNLAATYVDPLGYSTDPAISPIDSWSELAWNNNPLRLDTHKPSLGNDGSSSLLVRHVDTSTVRYFSNFFIYIAAKPRGAAMPGDQTGWGFRLSYIYPNI
jgi:hypothetical protein